MALTKEHRLSFEFFPPKTDAGAKNLQVTRDTLQKLSPDFFSVTYGAGGSTRDNTRAVVLDGIQAGCQIAPHLSFGGDSEDDLKQLIDVHMVG